MLTKNEILNYLQHQNQIVISKYAEACDPLGSLHFYDLSQKRYYKIMTSDFNQIITFENENKYLNHLAEVWADGFMGVESFTLQNLKNDFDEIKNKIANKDFRFTLNELNAKI